MFLKALIRNRRFPFVKQLSSSDCGLACLRMIGKFYKVDIASHPSFHDAYITKQGILLSELNHISNDIGFQTLAVNLGVEDIMDNVPLPSVFFWNKNHFIIVYKITKNSVYVADPALGKIKYNRESFLEGWGNEDKKGIILIYFPPVDPKMFSAFSVADKMNFSMIFKYLIKFKTQLVLIITTLFFSSIFELLFPFYTQKIIDKGVVLRDVNFLEIVFFSQLALFLCKIVNEYYRSWLFIHISPRIGILLITDFLMKLFSLPMKFFASKNVGDLLERIQDHKRVESFITNDILKSIFAIFTIIVYSIVLFYYNVNVFLIFLIGNTLQLSWLFLYLNKLAIIDQKEFDLLSKEQNKILELINGMQEIKLNNLEQDRKLGWAKIQEKLFQNNILKLTVNQKYELYRLFSFVTSLVIILVCAKSVINHRLTLGSMMAIIFVLGGINAPVSQIINFILNLKLVQASLYRLNEVYQLSEEKRSAPGQPLVLQDITIENVSFTYNNRDQILSDINLIIPSGKITAIVGMSGSGKTTLLKLLLKFYQPQNGSIKVGETDIEAVPSNIWRNRCGVIFQDSFIFSESISYNISLENNFDSEKLEKAIDFANIKDFINRLPLKVNTIIGLEGVGLSQGQKQRILIARAIYKNPDYLFFDEATNSLDTENEKIITQNINKYFNDKTMVVVAHRLSTVKDADQIVVMDNGKIIEQGNHSHLISLKGKYFELIRNQLELNN